MRIELCQFQTVGFHLAARQVCGARQSSQACGHGPLISLPWLEHRRQRLRRGQHRKLRTARRLPMTTRSGQDARRVSRERLPRTSGCSEQSLGAQLDPLLFSPVDAGGPSAEQGSALHVWPTAASWRCGWRRRLRRERWQLGREAGNGRTLLLCLRVVKTVQVLPHGSK